MCAESRGRRAPRLVPASRRLPSGRPNGAETVAGVIIYDRMPSKADGLAGLDEPRFARMTGISRSTRKTWQRAGLLVRDQRPPYGLDALLEAVAVRELVHATSSDDARIIWPMVRTDVVASGARARLDVAVDVELVDARVCRGDRELASYARRGRAVRVVELGQLLEDSRTAFDAALRAAPARGDDSVDEIGARRRRRGASPG